MQFPFPKLLLAMLSTMEPFQIFTRSSDFSDRRRPTAAQASAFIQMHGLLCKGILNCEEQRGTWECGK
jgi:hypothetical protein